MSSSPPPDTPPLDAPPAEAPPADAPPANASLLRRTWQVISTMSCLGMLVALVVVAVLFWPERFGGRTSLVMVSGNSMEPALRHRDLVFTHHERSHEVGDIIVYRIPDGEPGAGSLVIHRIIGGDGTTGYVTRGDNRDTPDPWRPTDDEVVGHVFVSTHLGSRLVALTRYMRSPLAVGAGAAILAFAAVWRVSRRTTQPVR